MLIADHQTKADIAASIAVRWFDTQNVVALMDVAASSPALAVMNVANQRKRPVILNGPGAVSITNESCNAYTVHYTYDTYANAHAVTKAVVDQGGKSWYYLTADYTFGHLLAKDSAVGGDRQWRQGAGRIPRADRNRGLLLLPDRGAVRRARR